MTSSRSWEVANPPTAAYSPLLTHELHNHPFYHLHFFPQPYTSQTLSPVSRQDESDPLPVQSHQQQIVANQPVLNRRSAVQPLEKLMSDLNPFQHHTSAAPHSGNRLSALQPFQKQMSAAQLRQQQMSAAQPSGKRGSVARPPQKQMSVQGKRPHTGEASPITPSPAKKPRPTSPPPTNPPQRQGASEEHRSMAEIGRLKRFLTLANGDIEQSASFLDWEQRVTKQDTDMWRDRANAYQQENERLEALLTKRDAEIASLKGRNAENTVGKKEKELDERERVVAEREKSAETLFRQAKQQEAEAEGRAREAEKRQEDAAEGEQREASRVAEAINTEKQANDRHLQNLKKEKSVRSQLHQIDQKEKRMQGELARRLEEVQRREAAADEFDQQRSRTHAIWDSIHQAQIERRVRRFPQYFNADGSLKRSLPSILSPKQ